MTSFHEIKASAPHPDESEGISAPQGYFGWEIRQKLQQQPAKMQTILPTDVTPERISRAIRGLPVFVESDDPTEELPVYDDSSQISPTANFRDLGKGEISRRTQRLHANQGGRSLQHHGSNHNGKRR